MAQLTEQSLTPPLDRQKRLTSRAYDRWSHIWELSRFTNRALYTTALGLLDACHQRVLDVGCGTGLLSAKLAATGRQVVGVDLSPAMLNRARRRNQPGLRFFRADAEELPCADGEFDAVVNLVSFHHYPNPARAAAEFRRVLRPGGRLVAGRV